MSRPFGFLVAGALPLAAACLAPHDTARPPVPAVVADPATSVPPSAPIASARGDAGPMFRFDAAAAARHLDERMATWMKAPPKVGNNFGCAMTCHTALPFAMSRGPLGEGDGTWAMLGQKVDERVRSVAHWKDAVPFYGARGTDTARRSLGSEAVLNAAVEAMLTTNGTREKSPVAASLARMWEAQRADGGFDWLDFGLAPWENGDELIGASFAARAVAAFPADMRAQDSERIARLVDFVRRRTFEDPTSSSPVLRSSVSLFAAASVSGASASLDELLSTAERQLIADLIVRERLPDGGFSWSALGVRAKDKNGAASDPLPTSIALLALLATPSRSESIDRAISDAAAWLAAHQATDGSFPSRSPNQDRPFSHLVMSDAATAYAVLALDEANRRNAARDR